MSKSIARVEAAGRAAGLDITVEWMPGSTRTAEEAAQACGYGVGQIVKSLIFERTDNGALVLLLVSGARQVDLAADDFGAELCRADPKRVRVETGFAIGGVAPIGHIAPLEVWMDRHLLKFRGSGPRPARHLRFSKPRRKTCWRPPAQGC